VDAKEQALEQYKSLVDDVGNVGTRYATANGFYLSVLTALIGVLAYVGTGKDATKQTYFVVLLVAVFAVIICWIWRETVRFYGRLFGAKFDLLKKLGAKLDTDVNVYDEEDDLAYYEEREDSTGKKRKVRLPGLTASEQRVPIFLGVFFILIGAAALLMLVIGR